MKLRYVLCEPCKEKVRKLEAKDKRRQRKLKATLISETTGKIELKVKK